MAVKLGNGNWAVKEDKLLAYNDNSGKFFNKEFDFARGSSATYVAKDGLIKSAASDVPRIDFSDSTNGALLLEPQSTNLIITSDSGVYGSSPAYGILTTAPDGTNTAVRPVPSSNSNRYTGQISGGTYATNTKITYSWYRKRISTPVIDTYVGDLQPGILVNVTQVGSTIQIKSDINGFDKFSATFNITDGSLSSNIRLYFGAIIGTGNSSVAYWGHQLEVGSYATSIIPTSGSTATRLADVCNNSGSAQDFNSEEGVLYAEIAALASSVPLQRIALSDGTDSNRVYIQNSSINNQIFVSVQSGGVSSVNNSTTAYDTTQFNKIAISYKTNDFSFWVNGTKIATDTSVVTPIGLNELAFDDGNGGNYFYGKTKNIQVFTEAKSDEFLAALTTI